MLAEGQVIFLKVRTQRDVERLRDRKISNGHWLRGYVPI